MTGQLQAILRQLTIGQRIGILGGALASVAMIAALVMFVSKPDYTPAFTGLSAAQAGSITSALRGANVAYEVADAGTTVLVPVGSLSQARIAAAQAGITTDGSGKGFELFDNQGFGMSQFDQQVTYQRALEGELTRTIQAMEGVASARVAIVLAQKGVLAEGDTAASASVVLSMASGVPTSGLVQAIVNTVASSVSGLKAENVVVTDDKGHVLAGAADTSNSAGAQAKDAVEQGLKTKVQALVDQALGAGHSSVAVSADVDMNKVEQEITTYTPLDTTHYTPVSVNRVAETYTGTDANAAGGIAGALSNIPGLPTYPGLAQGSQAPAATPSPTPSPTSSATASGSPAPSASASASASAAPTSATASGLPGYLRYEETVNYNLSATVQHVIQTPGVVKRLSVAVLVDQAALGQVDTTALKTTIEAAIGADAVRGDVVAINAVPFAAQASSAPVSAPTTDIVSTVGGMAGTFVGIGLALLFLLLFWLNSSALRRRADEMTLDLGPVPAAGLLMASSRGGQGEGQAQLPAELPEATPQARIQERLRMVADEKPDALVGLMHGWLREEDRRR